MIKETNVVAGRISDLITVESGLTKGREKFIRDSHYCSMLAGRTLDLLISHILVKLRLALIHRNVATSTESSVT